MEPRASRSDSRTRCHRGQSTAATWAPVPCWRAILPRAEDFGCSHDEIECAVGNGDFISTVRYGIGDVTYEREYFAGNRAEVLVFHFMADKPGVYSATIKLGDAHKAQIKAADNRITSRGNLDGYVYSSDATKQGVKDYAFDLDYEARLQVVHQVSLYNDRKVACHIDIFRTLLRSIPVGRSRRLPRPSWRRQPRLR